MILISSGHICSNISQVPFKKRKDTLLRCSPSNKEGSICTQVHTPTMCILHINLRLLPARNSGTPLDKNGSLTKVCPSGRLQPPPLHLGLPVMFSTLNNFRIHRLLSLHLAVFLCPYRTHPINLMPTIRLIMFCSMLPICPPLM